MRVPVIAIVGRPNVGKSSLFNRVMRQQAAIVRDEPGVTRDRIYGEARWEDHRFIVIDTGGLAPGEEGISETIMSQVQAAVDESDAVIFLVDGRSGAVPEDQEIATWLRRQQVPVYLAVNKLDSQSYESPKVQGQLADFYALGFDPHPISVAHNRGIGPLMDVIFSDIGESGDTDELRSRGIRFSFLGRPNAGKSSLVNAILGEQRLLVDDAAGTTRDAIEVPFEKDGASYVLVDTAGLRRRAKVKAGLEKLASLQSIRAIENSDVVGLVVDGTVGARDQEAKLASIVVKRGKALIIVLNKWDLIRGREARDRVMQSIEDQLRFVPWAPVIITSAQTGLGLDDLLRTVKEVHEERLQRIPTSELNRFMEALMEHHPPPGGRRPIKFYYATQAEVGPPHILIYTNRPEKVPDHYVRYIKNKLREVYGFRGTPLHISFRNAHDRG